MEKEKIVQIQKLIKRAAMMKGVHHQTPSVIYKAPYHCSTKSRWLYAIENGEIYDETNLAKDKMNKPVKYKEVAGLYDGGEVIFQAVETWKYKDHTELHIIIKNSSRRVNVIAHKTENDDIPETAAVKCNGEICTMGELCRTCLQKGLALYTLDGVIER